MSVQDRPELEFSGVQDCMFDALAFPGVGDVDETIAGLDNGWIGELFSRFVFEDKGGLPMFAIIGNRDIQRAAAFIFGVVIIDEELAAIFKSDRIGS